MQEPVVDDDRITGGDADRDLLRVVAERGVIRPEHLLRCGVGLWEDRMECRTPVMRPRKETKRASSRLVSSR